MFSPATLASNGSTADRTISLANATGIAIRGDTIAVATCSGAAGGVSTFSRSGTNATPVATSISVGCIWGISYDTGNTGKLWVASRSQNKVYRFKADFSGSDFGPTLTDAYGVAVDTAGNAWATSCSGSVLQQISSTGSLVGSAIALSDPSCPGGLAFD